MKEARLVVRVKGSRGKGRGGFFSRKMNGVLSVCCVDGKRDMIQGEGENRAEMQNGMECWVFVSVSLRGRLAWKKTSAVLSWSEAQVSGCSLIFSE